MATKNVTLPEAGSSLDIKRAKGILGDIAQCAYRNERLSFLSNGIIEGEEALSHEVDRLRELICQMGLMADIAATKLGGTVVCGPRMEDWTLRYLFEESDEVSPK
jgi:hypothetical protein